MSATEFFRPERSRQERVQHEATIESLRKNAATFKAAGKDAAAAKVYEILARVEAR